MYSIDELKKILNRRVSPKRYIHSIGVYETAVKLAGIYGVSQEKAGVSGLLHDYAKDLSEKESWYYIHKFDIEADEVIEKQIDLAHGFIGAELVKREIQIEDIEILDSIRYHTMGRKNMNTLEKIIFISDYIEPSRTFPKVKELREMAFNDLDKSIIMALDNTIRYVLEIGQLIHQDSIYARNDLLLKTKFR